MLLAIAKLIGGIAILLLSGKYLVKGGVELTKHFKISKLVVGMTVVAFGTSAPELLVSVAAALKGSPDIALGNVIGSNISNIALVLAFTAVLMPLDVQKDTIKFDMPIMIFAFFMLAAFMYNGHLTRIEGLIFLLLLVMYIVWEIRHSRQTYNEEETTEPPQYSIFISLLIIIAASTGLAFGADFLVDGASTLAKMLNISERVISISIVALGTSLPELTTSIIAVIKKEMDISIGNIVGSNIFNIFAILGTTAVVKPIEFDFHSYTYELLSMTLIGLLLWFFITPVFTKSAKFSRINGLFLLLVYVGYMWFLFTN